MQKQKRTHNKKYLNSGMIIVALCLIGILFAFVRHHLLTQNNYFININTAEEVSDIIASEFLVGETTKADIVTALDDGFLGELDCYGFPSGGWIDISDDGIICKALGSYDITLEKYYRIIFKFNGDMLEEITVQVTHNAP